jgi:hypothetical protein
MKESDNKYDDLLKTALTQPESYQEGAWENFRDKAALAAGRRRRRVLLTRYSSGVAAAAILILLMVMPGGYEAPLSVVNSPLNREEDISSLYRVGDSEKSGIGLDLSSVVAGIFEPHTGIFELRTVKETETSIVRGSVDGTVDEAEALFMRELNVLPDILTDGVDIFSDRTKLSDRTKVFDRAKVFADDSSLLAGRDGVSDPEETALERSRNNEKGRVERGVRQGRVVSGIREDSDDRRLHFGVNFSPGLNATGGAGDPAMSYSGGVNMDVKIAKRLSLSTGLQFERNSVESVSRSPEGVMPSSHTSATISNLDIPLNITWNFMNDRSGSYYVSGGVSTLAYLGEEYSTTSYRQEVRGATLAMEEGAGVTTYSMHNVETVSSTSVPPYSGVDFAGRVNLMLGYSYRISPQLRVHVEPYVKIPLSGLASREIRYTTGGVTFKVSF